MRLSDFYPYVQLFVSFGTEKKHHHDHAQPSKGCGLPLPYNLMPGGASQKVITPDGNRGYRIFVGKDYNISTPAPLYFSFHGGSKNAENQECLSQFSNHSYNPNGIAVYPNATEGYWQGSPQALTHGNTDDISFVLNILANLTSVLCVDESRVYAAGKSQGGGMVNMLACNKTSSSHFAAFAPVSGAFYRELIGHCDPGRVHTPILEFHGGNDGTIPYNGGVRSGYKLECIPSWINGWAERNHCLSNACLYKTASFYSGETTTRTWSIDEKALVAGVYNEKIGHSWPSQWNNSDNKGNPANMTKYEATKVIFDFFSEWTL